MSKPCEKKLCDLGHNCLKKCWEDCGDRNVKIDKDLPCGHNLKIKCHIKPEDFGYREKV